MVTETNRYIKLIKASQYFDDAMRYLAAGDIDKPMELLILAKQLYEELEEQRIVTLIEKIMEREPPEGASGSRIIRITHGTQGLTWMDLFLIVVICGLLVYIFMRRPK